jgi:hypothetical protein
MGGEPKMTRSSDAPTPVVFIVGAARSGSTVLELLLAQLDGTVAVGEVRTLWSRAVTGKARCGCGSQFDACSFWQAIDHEYGGFEHDLQQERTLRKSVLRIRRLPALLNVPGTPATWRDQLAEYRGLLARLYAAIQAANPGRTIVDSSKHGLYALALLGVPNLDVKMVHLVRDPRAVAFSMSRTKQRIDTNGPTRMMPRASGIETAATWVLRNALARSAVRRSVKGGCIRYEDLAHDPGATIMRLGPLIAIQDVDLGFLVGSTAHIGPGHGLSGNPIRAYGRSLEIRLDEEWRYVEKPWRSAMVFGLTFPFAMRYGYRPRHTVDGSAISLEKV